MAEKKTLEFGTLSAISGKTPLWAKWMFRSIFILTTVAVFIIGSDPAFTDAFKIRALIYLKGLDMAVYGFSKLFGIKIDKPDTSEPMKPY